MADKPSQTQAAPVAAAVNGGDKRPNVKFLPSQIGSNDVSAPLPWTGNPWQLVWGDIRLFFAVIGYLPVIFFPFSKNPGDETYPEWNNVVQIGWQIFLVIYQVAFVLSLPFCLAVPLGWFIVYCVTAICLNIPIWWIVNGFDPTVQSQPKIASDKEHPDEYWIFINGVSVGRYWLQANVDRLAKIFGRPVTGIHNPTNGMIFDLIQCMVERNFGYSTQDVRDAYKLVKEALMDEKRKKVMLILHSQGGIQGGLIVDWLLAEMPGDIMRKLEVYTFGCAANHFNNPHRSSGRLKDDEAAQRSHSKHKVIRYIEHYANDSDFVANWGILNFAHIANRFMGRLLQREGMGHLLNQHYLNYMFPLGPDDRALETNEFMETDVSHSEHDQVPNREGFVASLCDILDGSSDEEDTAVVRDSDTTVNPVDGLLEFKKKLPKEVAEKLPRKPKVKDFSRLWQYRNGGTPEERRRAWKARAGLPQADTE
ncbi:uncharacterized protein K452DRAFT_282924 [Aplosporella prunicola CBS 121167]|uniref:DUF676 domain-containing protein n=1 Tax=Aplosporella prunicola CBS 121167 TaxID=1176127 RepID=A0A6A6BTY9_9PEZI|nr:uncharacterized protein K452DRAFT_282924 [Aplosporella prunicola CBS 121167]KAF2146735.1 hypothetical protein K452DRAFT_282924 [Aplosporella prunicola CBS 121167]